MTKIWLAGLVLSLLVLGAQGCAPVGAIGGARTVRGVGPLAAEERPIGEATGVRLTTAGELSISLGERPQLVIEAERNLLPYYETTVREGILTISVRDGTRLVSNTTPRFALTLPSLDAVILTSSGRVRGPNVEGATLVVKSSGSGEIRLGDVTTQALSVTSSGSGPIHLGRVSAQQLDVETSGSGRVTVAGGEVDVQRVRLSGSGSYLAADLATATAEVRVSGSGSAEVFVRQRLTARLSGSGSVRYRGSPTVDAQVSGTGRVIHVEN